MSNVTSIRTSDNSRMVRSLEKVLEQARKGEVLGVAIATSKLDNNTEYYLVGNVIASFSMLGAVNMLGAEMQKIMLQSEDMGE